MSDNKPIRNREGELTTAKVTKKRIRSEIYVQTVLVVILALQSLKMKEVSANKKRKIKKRAGQVER